MVCSLNQKLANWQGVLAHPWGACVQGFDDQSGQLGIFPQITLSEGEVVIGLVLKLLARRSARARTAG